MIAIRKIRMKSLLSFDFFLLFWWYNVIEYCSYYFVGMEPEKGKVLNLKEARIFFEGVQCEFGHICKAHDTISGRS